MKNSARPHYLNNLNEQQLTAVLDASPALLILAGAGSGKTRVITTKIAYALDRWALKPQEILAVTFTNKAAEEMRQRLSQLSPMSEQVLIKTFHSFGAWLLRHYGYVRGIRTDFLIYDEQDALSLLKLELQEENALSRSQYYLELIMRAKDQTLGFKDRLSSLSSDPDFPRFYARYQQRLRQTGNLDFGDLLLESVLLLRENPALQIELQKRFKLILVDEFQDSNQAQFELLKLLQGPTTALCVVGDDDQSIYGFRGAQVENILNFTKHFPNTKVINLEINYRSTQKILAAASAVIAHNQQRMPKKMVTDNSPGQALSIYYLADYEAEAQLVSQLIEERPGLETAVLYRMNYQSRPLEEVLIRKRIPYRLIGSFRFYEREEIKDALAYLSLLVNPCDEIALKRIINKPSRGIGEKTQEELFRLLKQRADQDLIKFIRNYVKEADVGRPGKTLRSWLELYQELLQLLFHERLDRFLNEMIFKTGLYEYYRAKPDGEERIKNLEELINAATSYGEGVNAVNSFLENIILASPEFRDTGSEVYVSLITLHNTKGLEFERVIITGCEEGVFPLKQSFRGETDFEEERRLFYVGLTRGRQEVVLTCCQRRLLFGNVFFSEPSRFLDELPQDLIKKIPMAMRKEPFTTQNFKRGDRVYSDDFGRGYVVKSQIIEGDEVVTVRFDSGHQVPIILKYQELISIVED